MTPATHRRRPEQRPYVQGQHSNTAGMCICACGTYSAVLPDAAARTAWFHQHLAAQAAPAEREAADE